MKNYKYLFVILFCNLSVCCIAQQIEAVNQNFISNSTVNKEAYKIISYHIEEKICDKGGCNITTYNLSSLRLLDTTNLGNKNTRTITPIYMKSSLKIMGKPISTDDIKAILRLENEANITNKKSILLALLNAKRNKRIEVASKRLKASDSIINAKKYVANKNVIRQNNQFDASLNKQNIQLVSSSKQSLALITNAKTETANISIPIGFSSKSEFETSSLITQKNQLKENLIQQKKQSVSSSIKSLALKSNSKAETAIIENQSDVSVNFNSKPGILISEFNQTEILKHKEKSIKEPIIQKNIEISNSNSREVVAEITAKKIALKNDYSSNELINKTTALVKSEKKVVFVNVNVEETYERILNKGYESVNMLKKVGDKNYFDSNYEIAGQLYSKLIAISSDLEPDYYFRYYQCLRATNQIDKANEIFLKFESIKL